MSGLLLLASEHTAKKSFSACCYAVALVVLYGCSSRSAGNSNAAQGGSVAGAGNGTANSSGGASEAGGTNRNWGGSGASFSGGGASFSGGASPTTTDAGREPDAAPTATDAGDPPDAAPTSGVHRIAVRKGVQGVSNAEFYDVVTGQAFSPKGYNYEMEGGLFNNYDAAASDRALGEMAAYGATLVRVVIRSQGGGITGSCTGTACLNGNRLDPGYLDDVADFIRRAADHGLHVTISYDWSPPTYDVFGANVREGAPGDTVGLSGATSLYLGNSGPAKQGPFLIDVSAELKARDPALLDYIFSWSLQNEPYINVHDLPFGNVDQQGNTWGLITTADGVRYDMSKPGDRIQCANADWVHWSTQLAAAIHGANPLALASVDVSAYLGLPGLAIPATTDKDPNHRVMLPTAIIEHLYAPTVDYLDWHAYIDPDLYNTGVPYSLPAYLAQAQYASIDLTKQPMLAGEYGVRSGCETFGHCGGTRGTPEQACNALVTQRNAFLKAGFAGSLLWSWNWSSQDYGVWWTGVINGDYTIASCLR